MIYSKSRNRISVLDKENRSQPTDRRRGVRPRRENSADLLRGSGGRIDAVWRGCAQVEVNLAGRSAGCAARPFALFSSVHSPFFQQSDFEGYVLCCRKHAMKRRSPLHQSSIFILFKAYKSINLFSYIFISVHYFISIFTFIFNTHPDQTSTMPQKMTMEMYY